MRPTGELRILKTRKPHKRGRAPSLDRKDFLIQTRVPEGLDSTLKEEARKRRVTVSQLIRNVLHDSFELVDNVVANVDGIVNQSVNLAKTVSSDAQRVAAAASGQDVRGFPRPPFPAPPAAPARPPAPAAAPPVGSPFDSVYGWQKLISNLETVCAHCGNPVKRGSEVLRGLSDDAAAPKLWLHPECLEKI